MNKMQLRFALALLISAGAVAMEEKVDSPECTQCKFIEYKFNGPTSLVCPLFDQNEVATLVTQKGAQEEDEHLQVMVDQINKSETLMLFADVLKLYRNSRYPYRPWCGSLSASAKRNIELAIPELQQAKVEGENEVESLEFYNAVHQEIGMIDEQKKQLRKLMAAQVALHLLECAELDQKIVLAKEKLKEDAAQRSNSTKN